MVGLGRRRPRREKSSPRIGQKAAVDLKVGIKMRQNLQVSGSTQKSKIRGPGLGNPHCRDLGSDHENRPR